VLGLGVGFYGVGGDMDVKGSWLPSDEASLEAWYKVGTGITDAKPGVTAWANQSSVGSDYDMLQSNVNRRPTVTGSGLGVITFSNTSSSPNLPDQLEIDVAGGADHIELDGAFVMGLKFNATLSGSVVVGSNRLGDEMLKLQTTTKLRLKNDSGTKDFELSSGSTTDDSYWVISRDGSDDVTVYKDGSTSVFSTSMPQSRSGTFDIDAIGVRHSGSPGGGGTNNFDGTVTEIMIFKGTTSAALIANVNDRLSTL